MCNEGNKIKYKVHTLKRLIKRAYTNVTVRALRMSDVMRKEEGKSF